MLRRSRLRSMSAKRRAVLAGAGVRFPSTTFAPAARRPARLEQATVDVVLERDGYRCVVCGDELLGHRGVEWSIHHRKRRSQGGDDRLSNLISVCGDGRSGCHGDVHRAPERARRVGWMLRRGDVPELRPVVHSQRADA